MVTAYLSEIMGETDDRYVLVEEGPGGRSECDARGGESFEIDGGSGKVVLF